MWARSGYFGARLLIDASFAAVEVLPTNGSTYHQRAVFTPGHNAPGVESTHASVAEAHFMRA